MERSSEETVGTEPWKKVLTKVLSLPLPPTETFFNLNDILTSFIFVFKEERLFWTVCVGKKLPESAYIFLSVSLAE